MPSASQDATGGTASVASSPSSGGEPLVARAADGQRPSPYAGFVSDSIGVGQNGSEGNGQPCGRIDAGADVDDEPQGHGASAGKLIDFAEIDLELKFGGHRRRVTGYLVNGSHRRR